MDFCKLKENNPLLIVVRTPEDCVALSNPLQGDADGLHFGIYADLPPEAPHKEIISLEEKIEIALKEKLEDLKTNELTINVHFLHPGGMKLSTANSLKVSFLKR